MTAIQGPKPVAYHEHIQVITCSDCGGQALRREYRELEVPPVVLGHREEIAETVKAHPLDIPLLVVGVMAIAAFAVGVQHLMAGEYFAASVLAVWTVATFAAGFIVARSLCTCERPPSAGESQPAEASNTHRAS